jgi:antitoxin YefM
MIIKPLPTIESPPQITILSAEIAKTGNNGALAITQQGKPVLAVMTWDLYESLIETLEILGDPEMMNTLRQSIHEIQEGKTVSLAEVKLELGL